MHSNRIWIECNECIQFRGNHYVYILYIYFFVIVVVTAAIKKSLNEVGAVASVQSGNTENERRRRRLRQTSAVQVVWRILDRKYIHMAVVSTIFRGTTAKLCFVQFVEDVCACVCARARTFIRSARACVCIWIEYAHDTHCATISMRAQ